MNREEYYEYNGDFTFTVTDGERGPVLRFHRDGEVVTEIYLSRTGAQTLGVALLRRT
jgi:hypothetical protein